MSDFLNITLEEYLSDRSRLSGSVLSMVEKDPRDLADYLDGKPPRKRKKSKPGEEEETAAMALGTYVHAILLEGPDVAKARTAFAPSRADAIDENGLPAPQDSSDYGKRKKLETRSKVAKAQWAAFERDAKGKTIILPEQQPIAMAMARAVGRHEEARDLLRRDGFEPEMTVHWTCDTTGEAMRARPDGIRRAERRAIEVKTVARLDPDNDPTVMQWLRGGWARKTALVLDGIYAITGENWELAWILVEATEHDPRVCVMRASADAVDSSMYTLGREGSKHYGIRGYIELVQRLQWHREHRDFRTRWERERGQTFRLPAALESSLAFEHAQGPVVHLTGARRVEVANG